MKQNKRNSRIRKGEMPTAGLKEKTDGNEQTREAGNGEGWRGTQGVDKMEFIPFYTFQAFWTF